MGKRDLPLPASKLVKKNFYSIGAAGPPKDNTNGTDFYSIDSDKISITPIIYDLTDKNILDDINNKWV